MFSSKLSSTTQGTSTSSLPLCTSSRSETVRAEDNSVRSYAWVAACRALT